jgi:ABC-type glycerol-3-phosphate transport system substrate-binding protein
MKKAFIWIITVVLILTFTFIQVGCKGKVTPAEEVVTETVETAQTETVETAQTEKTFWEMIQDGDLNFDGQEVVYCYEGGLLYEEYIKKCAAEFEALTGAKIVLDPTPWEGQMPKIVNDVTTGANRFDVFEGDIEYQYGLYGYMEELTPWIEKYNVNMDGFFKPMYDFGEWSGKGRFGLPFSTGVSTFVIRTDVFDKAGISYPFDTWEDFHAALAKVNDPDNGFYGTAFAGVSGQLVKMYLARIWGQKKAVFSKTWDVQVNSPEGIKATDLLVDYMKYAPPGVLGWGLPEAAAAFLAGDTAVHEDWFFAIAGIIDNPDESNIVGKWTVIPAPGGGPSGNFTQHNVDLLKGSDNKDASFCWMAYITSEERQVQAAEDEINLGSGGFDYTRTKAWTDVRLPALPQLQGLYDSLQAGIPITVGLPQWLEAFMAIGESSGQAMSGELTSAQAMEGLEATLKGIIQQSIPPYECIESNFVEK